MSTSLTPEFNEVEHLQSTIRRWQNREIRDYFRDLNIDDTWSPDLTQPRQSLAQACLHKDADNLQTTALRAWLFAEIRGQAYRVPIFGIPKSSFDEQRRYKPQVTLFFKEALNDVEEGYPPVTGEISFRLMNETESTLTEANLNTLAMAIRREFSNGSLPYRWRKGKKMVTYSDWSKGYQLQLLCRSETEGEQLIRAVLGVQGHTYQEKFSNLNQNRAETTAYPTIPPMRPILGRPRREPRRRPMADCLFQHAEIAIHGLPNAIPLFDMSYAKPNALIRSY